jgi:hypothetical protein
VLLGQRRFELKTGESLRDLPAEALAEGPLGLFLDRTIGRRMREEDGKEQDGKEQHSKGVLHVINIRDWHVPDDNYDFERRRYGAHCEAGTWGAGYVDGLEKWLDPAAADPMLSKRARYFEQGSVRIHHVHADSIFDFRPRAEYIEADAQIRLVPAGDPARRDRARVGGRQKRARELLLADPQARALLPLERRSTPTTRRARARRVYVGVIGFYTDIKVAIVLCRLRATSCRTRRLRHLHGERHARAPPGRARLRPKLLNVEVVHGINDLVGFLGGTGDLQDESEIVAADTFSRYQATSRTSRTSSHSRTRSSRTTSS